MKDKRTITKHEEKDIVKVGLYNDKFKMSSGEMLEERTEKVRGRDANFAIIAGPLVLGGQTMKDTYLLDIDYEASYSSHRNSLPWQGFGQCLFYDYGEKANELAKDFCNKNNLILNNHLNSWPKYQAVVSRKGGK
jgi:hypothetical protein